MLTRLSAQNHDYNLKLTKEELLSIGRAVVALDGWMNFDRMIELIEKEAKRLGAGTE